MHEPLGVTDRANACSEFIKALHACHDKSAWSRFTGMCNDEKDALNLCLRKERIDRTTRNREAAKDRTRKKAEAWAALDSELNGDDQQPKPNAA
ncbi:COX assembly mitochondrial protein 2 [Vanrija pseudolonga]|uniref:COX assembly mitochondrial protein n=1 Tax=Vanrija pseudolonga TaxID=143232 RepID=A0AAF0YF83_9TREE|nr:COX assembly mitochondrial protein 2 [Vanrija pseudolonga]